MDNSTLRAHFADPMMDLKTQLLSLLDDTLNLGGRASSFTEDTRLLGQLPEMDPMGVVSILTAFEDRLGFAVDDDDVDGTMFQTVGSLLAFVRSRVTA